MKTLEIADVVKLPLDVVTERVAFVGQSGSGKTYAAMRLAELMLEAGAQIIALDPMGVWWGLLSAANGKASGYPVHVFGGEHAHVPLVPESGALVAEVIVQRGISAVIDISHFTRSEQVMFSSAFAERFYELQVKAKVPVHLFFEEAHTFLPQNLPAEGRGGDPRKNPAVMLNRMERIVRQGRSQGVGCSMITQQPQAVNKAALNQAGTLFAMRTMGKHERKAVGDWMADKATDDSQLKLDQLLPKLGTGEAWIASPHFLALFKHAHITKKTTFDSSATPKFGVKLEAPKVLADVDVETLREAMKSVVEVAEKDDPAALRKRIAELERQAAAKTKVIEHVEVPVLKGEELKRLEAAVEKADKAYQHLLEATEPLQNALEQINGTLLKKLSAAPLKVAAPSAPKNGSNGATHYERPTPAPKMDGVDVKKGGREMLRELVALHPASMTRRELATRAVISHSSSTFSEYLGALKSAGLVELDDNGDVRATSKGVAAAGKVSPKAPTDIAALWGAKKFKRGARVMLDLILANPGERWSRQRLAKESAISETSSTFSEYLGALRSSGVVDQVGKEYVAGHALFLGDGR